MASTPSYSSSVTLAHARRSSSPEVDQYGDQVALWIRVAPRWWNGLPGTFFQYSLRLVARAASRLPRSSKVACPSSIRTVATASVAPPE
jgi:hypothetical protein